MMSFWIEKNIKASVFLWAIFLWSTHLLAQAPDSNYIETFSSNDNITTGFQYKSYQLLLFTNTELAYKFKNSGLGIVIGGRVGKFGLTVALPVKNLIPSFSQELKRFGLTLRLYQPRYYFELGGQNIVGFEAENKRLQERVFREDIRLWGFSAYGFKVMNPKLSLRSSFRNSQRQLQSQGSWLLSLTLNAQTFSADSIRLQEEEEDPFIIDRYQQLKLGAGIGYAYTWVFAPKWYLTPVLVVGPEIRFLHYRTLENGNARDRARVSPRTRGSLAFGYNGDNIFTAIEANWLPGYDIGKQLNTRVRDAKIRFKIGYRFNG